MCIGEVDSLGSKFIDVWRFRLRMPAQEATPIVHVVDANHQHIRTIIGRVLAAYWNCDNESRKQHEASIAYLGFHREMTLV